MTQKIAICYIQELKYKNSKIYKIDKCYWPRHCSHIKHSIINASLSRFVHWITLEFINIFVSMIFIYLLLLVNSLLFMTNLFSLHLLLFSVYYQTSCHIFWHIIILTFIMKLNFHDCRCKQSLFVLSRYS